MTVTIGRRELLAALGDVAARGALKTERPIQSLAGQGQITRVDF